MATKGMPLIPLFLVGAIVCELVGGLSLLLGYRARLGALLLFLYLIPTTLVFHAFWQYEGMQHKMQLINFMKNLAIMGGLAVVMGFGSGLVSIDRRRGGPST
jgi:putative oxidoreductase